MRIYRFTVRGKGGFPFGMLYQCEAWPATRADAENIVFACATQAPEWALTFATRKELSGTDREMWTLEKWPILRID